MAVSICKLVLTAFTIVAVLFMEIFACVADKSAFLLLILLPLTLTPVPLLLARCCGGSDAFSSGSKCKHCTPSQKHTRPRPPACHCHHDASVLREAAGAEFLSAFCFTGTIAIPVLLYQSRLVQLGGLLLSLGGVLVALLALGIAAYLHARAESDPFGFTAW